MAHIASQWYLYSKVIRSTNEQVIGFIINNQQVHRSDPILSEIIAQESWITGLVNSGSTTHEEHISGS